MKRAAPGGAGLVVDPFSSESLSLYFNEFEEAFKKFKRVPVRSFFHDSYEYYGADWTKNFFSEFKKRRGYNLEDVLPLLVENSNGEAGAGVKYDYRLTIAGLHEEFIKTAAAKSAKLGALFRNQAHGSPGSLPDIYAAADIPETEVFGTPSTLIPGITLEREFTRSETVEPLLLKFASSAAHVTGKKLVSSETGTWLTEHFHETLALLKPEIDLLFTSGINHIFFHGIPYSPLKNSWPGWQFYASSDFGPNGSLWRNLPAMAGYIARCQEVLQEGEPGNDLLLYFPVSDLWNTNGSGLVFMQMHNPKEWLFNTPFYNTAKKLYSLGYGFDYISDKQLTSVKRVNNGITAGGGSYKGIIIPACKYMPPETLAKIKQLLDEGVKIFFVDSLPCNAPGYYEYEKRRGVFNSVKDKIKNNKNYYAGSPDKIDELFLMSGEKDLAKRGLRFIKRKTSYGFSYFIANHDSVKTDGFINLASGGKSFVIIDPLNGKKGIAELNVKPEGGSFVRLQIEPGASLILKAYKDSAKNEARWIYSERGGKEYALNGKWKVEFTEGGPKIPAPQIIDSLKSWTEFYDAECENFFGTAKYTLKFNNPDETAPLWQIDLGRVCNSASVKINGLDAGVLWAFPFKTGPYIKLKPGENIIEIETANSSANRIRGLDKKGVDWKIFYDINFVNINYKKFNAVEWRLCDSGLLGPVKLIRVLSAAQ